MYSCKFRLHRRNFGAMALLIRLVTDEVKVNIIWNTSSEIEDRDGGWNASSEIKDQYDETMTNVGVGGSIMPSLISMQREARVYKQGLRRQLWP